MDEPAAVDYLLRKHPEWRSTYTLFGNHWAAMSVVAQDLSDACGLPIFAGRIWVGGGSTALGLVLMGTFMGVKNRTPEDDQRLKDLEQNLVTPKLVSTPELEVLCSATFPPHLNEPLHISLRPAPKNFSPGEILRSIKYWKRQSRRKERRKNL